jgi:hypothetical protein
VLKRQDFSNVQIGGTFSYQWRYKLLIIIPTSLHNVNKTYKEYNIRSNKYPLRNRAETNIHIYTPTSLSALFPSEYLLERIYISQR